MAIYYVRPNGNNTNAGTGYLSTQAWATLSKAATTMVAGDTCYVAPGIYREVMALNNNGSVGLPITLYGDRKCERFLDMTMGDVVVDGMNTTTDQAPARNSGISAVKNYVTIANIDVQNIASGGNAIEIGSYGLLLNCNINKNISGKGIYAYPSTVIVNCRVNSFSTAIALQTGWNNIVINCFLRTGMVADVIVNSGANAAEFRHCIIEGSYLTAVSGANLNIYGCLWSAGSAGSNTLFISLPSGCYITSKGSTFVGRGSAIYPSGSGTLFRGTKFKDMYALYSSNYPPTVTYCEFEDCLYGFYTTSTTLSVINNCYFKHCYSAINCNTNDPITANSCRFFENGAIKIGSGTFTNNTPTYGETDIVAGIVASDVSPLSGTKSLKIAGYDYGTVFTQWIPCEAGVPKTVKMKIKRNSATVGTQIRFGDKEYSKSGAINICGVGWFNSPDVNHSGGTALATLYKDDFIEFTFSGTGVRFLTQKYLFNGIMAASVDGGAETNIDSYNSTVLYKQNIFEVTGLTNSTHTLKIRNTGTKNASATNYYAVADAFEYYNSSTWTRVEVETVSTSVETMEITYTHHKTELVPLFINTRVNTNGYDFVQYDDIQMI